MVDAPRRIGRAFLEAVSQEGPGEDIEVEGPSLANARRRQVFRHLCLRPCARVGDMARVLALSQATVRWHGWNLLSNGYLEMEANRMFPQGLIDPADASLFVLLTAPGRADVYRACHDDPGLSLQELGVRVGITRQSASKIATEMTECGILRIEEDGRFRRGIPTDVMSTKRVGNAGRVRLFVDRLLRRLEDDGLDPELLRREEETALLRFGVGPHRVVLDLPTDPYVTSWRAFP